jgi:protein-S-isoprenylcysteine O-methyltransferase Ste14
MTGAPVFVALRLLDRQRQRAYWPVVAALAALGLAGNLSLQLHCPITHPVHLVLGHATVALIAVGVALVAWRWVGARSS